MVRHPMEVLPGKTIKGYMRDIIDIKLSVLHGCDFVLQADLELTHGI